MRRETERSSDTFSAHLSRFQPSSSLRKKLISLRLPWKTVSEHVTPFFKTRLTFVVLPSRQLGSREETEHPIAAHSK
jgi:hypothetical protein